MNANVIDEIKILESKLQESKQKESYYHAMQMALKLVLNGSYGAFCNRFFACFNTDIGNAITAQGRNITQWISAKHEDYWYNKWHLDFDLHEKLGIVGLVSQIDKNSPIWIYSDTDSSFFNFSGLISSINLKMTPEEISEFLLKLNDLFIDGFNINLCNQYAQETGTPNEQVFAMEKIIRSGIFLAKKAYILNIVWEEGKHYENLTKVKPVGIDIIKSDTPPFVRKKAKSTVEWILKQEGKLDLRELVGEIRKIKREFELQDPGEISKSTSCNNYKKWIIEDQTKLTFESGTPIGVKSAGIYNYLLHKNSKYKTKYERIKSGSKIKMYYTKDPEHPTFGYMRGSWPMEFAPEVDYDLMFEKTYLAIINRFVWALGLPKIDKRISFFSSLEF